MGVYLRGRTWYLDFYHNRKRYTERIGKDGPVNVTIAKEKLIVRQREAIQGEYKPKRVEVSFEKFKDLYLKFSLANKKAGTAKRDTVSLGSLQRFFGARFLSEISPFLIEKYKQCRRAEKVGPRTVNIELACLRHMFNVGMKWGKALTNPMAEVKLFKEPEGKDRILSPEEEVKLFEAIRANRKAKHLELMIMTALLTGMRLGEVLGLKWANVDLRNRLITIEGTKSGRIRKIPMSGKLTEILDHGRKENHGDYVFGHRSGKPFKSCRTAFDNALRKAGIEGVTFHSLRHTFGSRLGMQGTDVKTIQELMGHADIKMTMRYSHPTAEHKRRAVEMLDGVTTVVTTQGVDREDRKVITIGNR